MILSGKQRQAVECLDNCLVVACPGSGKTRVLVNKVDHIIGLEPEAKILIVSFTSDSAKEIRTRVIDAIGESNSRLVASGTFHSVSLSQLRQGAAFTGSVIGDGLTKQYVERALIESKLSKIPLEEAMAFLENAKMNPDYDPHQDEHGRLYVAYTKLTERNNVIDFTDMLARTVRLMRLGELAPKSCKYLMIDESQDMDEMQYAWACEHIKAGSKFTVVGDDDQSIYKFRRALGYAGMQRFVDNFDANLITLDTNYRCRDEILTAAAKLIVKNKTRVDKALFAQRGKGGEVEVMLFADAGTEAMYATQLITKLSEGTPVRPPLKYKAKLEDGTYVEKEYVYQVGIKDDEWAILVRNNYQLKVLASAMRAKGIPIIYSGKDIWSDTPVCLAISLLDSLASKGKKTGFDAALHFAGIDHVSLDILHERYPNFRDIFFDNATIANSFSTDIADTINELGKWVAIWSKVIDRKKDYRISGVIRGVFDWFMKQMDANSCGSKDKYHKQLGMLVNASKILSSLEGSIFDRLFTVTSDVPPLDKKTKEKNKEKDTDGIFGAITLGTLHSSKGLEFDNVWLLSMSDGVIPDIKQENLDDESQEEERRLFYVGMTRAKNRLIISAVGEVSSFVNEIEVPIKDMTELNLNEAIPGKGKSGEKSQKNVSGEQDEH